MAAPTTSPVHCHMTAASPVKKPSATAFKLASKLLNPIRLLWTWLSSWFVNGRIFRTSMLVGVLC
ncbi:uncharacterized protein DS421_15g515380 [Arachis hypogaea]|nr:uncharacterized protein DS421_15g515380 [Arachis hypogaea]